MVSTARLDELLDSLGPRECVIEEMRGLDEDVEYYFRVREELLAAHEYEWVAIYRQQIVATSAHRDTVVSELHARKIPEWRALIHMVDRTPRGAVPARYRLDLRPDGLIPRGGRLRYTPAA